MIELYTVLGDVICQMTFLFSYLSHILVLGIPDDNGIFRSRDHTDRYNRNIFADNRDQMFH